MENSRDGSASESEPSPKKSIQHDSNILEGVSTEVRLLHKLIQEHNAASREIDGRRPQRLSTMLTIIDDIRSRVQKSQSSVPSRKAELRRCTTEMHRNSSHKDLPNAPYVDKDKKSSMVPGSVEENQELRRQLSMSMTARKGLEKMFYSLGKEKELIAAELSRKVQELECAEELVNDLRAQNEKLTDKLRKEYDSTPAGNNGDALLHERIKELTEQMMKSMEGYRSMKRRLKEAMEEKEMVSRKIAETAIEAASGTERIRKLREKIGGRGEGKEVVGDKELEEELRCLEKIFVGFSRKLLITSMTRGRESPKGSPRATSFRKSEAHEF